ncbi:sugar transferase [Halomicroarcula sp. F13]|uniref:Sugar transferase n=1 Tax=Haloarcula rubra TaxID=2487747 RepID=A0AAW4PS05_9EURY|nr:sugar transferase [Halomicroarcula rubra]MBX0324025.1 sugar transferase [Halomicroarcula rubra]
MDSGWRYRLVSISGVVLLTAITVALVNNATVQSGAQAMPVLKRLSGNPTTAPEFTIELLLAVSVFSGAFMPLYKPRPRRILDIVSLTHKRIFVAVFALATIGYFDYSYRLPRLSVLLMTPLLLVALPAWFVWIRQRPSTNGDRTIVVGDDFEVIESVANEIKGPLLGYLCPTSAMLTQIEARAVPDGGVEALGLERLGGLSRIEDVLVEYDIDTVVLAFSHSDRAEFFGALDACYEHGVDAKVHQKHADAVLTADSQQGSLVEVAIEPWDLQDYLIKRAFDVVFSVAGLVTLTPVICVISAIIKLEDRGPVLYSQERTAVLGETFNIHKFRTMVPDSGKVEPIEDVENDRITKVGRLLRQTHFDEIPQLWSILRGDMSVVGPRAVWTDEEHLLEAESEMWRKRWFVKPGLTGLAQIHNANSTNPEQKLRYDLEYVRKQSFRFDLQIVARQIWKVFDDLISSFR